VRIFVFALFALMLVACTEQRISAPIVIAPTSPTDMPPSVVVLRIKNYVRVTQNLVAMKRKSRDVIAVFCMNDQIKQLRAIDRNAQERVRTMQQAEASGDSYVALNERAAIGSLWQRTDHLLGEFRHCM
jgi:hypothetical protein